MSSSDLMFDTSAPASAVVKALTTVDGIASFWTSRIDGDAGVDQQMTLTFPGPKGVVDYVLSTTQATADSATWAYEAYLEHGTEDPFFDAAA